jgi:hypothetical protein
MARHNWDIIKKEYVEGIKKDGQMVYPSQASLCEKYKIEPAYMSRKVKAGQWDIQREILDNKITTKRQEKKIDVISNEGSQFDLDCFNAAKIGMNKIVSMISQCYCTDDASKLSTALKNFQAVGKASLGDKNMGNNDVTINVTITEDE